MKSRSERRDQLFIQLQIITRDLNRRCDEFVVEVREIEDRLTDLGIGTAVRIRTADGDYGYRRVGERWRLVAFAGTEEDSTFKPLSDLCREEKIKATGWLDDILQAVVEEAQKMNGVV